MLWARVRHVTERNIDVPSHVTYGTYSAAAANLSLMPSRAAIEATLSTKTLQVARKARIDYLMESLYNT